MQEDRGFSLALSSEQSTDTIQSTFFFGQAVEGQAKSPAVCLITHKKNIKRKKTKNKRAMIGLNAAG